MTWSALLTTSLAVAWRFIGNLVLGCSKASRGISFEAEKSIPASYRGTLLCHQRLDLLIGGQIVLEVKSVEALHPVHVAQVLSYLHVAGVRLGLLINFNVPVLKAGIKRVIV